MEKLKELGRSVTGVKRKMANWAKDVALRGNMNLEKGCVSDDRLMIFKTSVYKPVSINANDIP